MGFSTPAEENELENISLDEHLIKNRDATFIIKMRGNSMQESGIFAGDMVIVERGRDPRPNDIVLCGKNGAFALQYFSQLPRSNSLSIDAVVIGIVRSYE